jgi:hypothetical protein
VSSPKEYRDFAIEIGKHVSATRDERLRETLLEMARLWIETALQVERSWALVDDDALCRPSLGRHSEPSRGTARSH